MLVRKLKALILGAEIRCIRSRNTFPGFLSHWVFTPGFRIGQRITGVFSVGFFLVSCYANFFTYVTVPALKFFDHAYLYNTFLVDRYISIYIFQAIVMQQYSHLHIDVHVLPIWFHKLVHSVRLCWLIKRWSCLFEGTMHESRTRLCCWCCLALARGVRRVVMKRYRCLQEKSSSNCPSFAVMKKSVLKGR